MSKGLFGKNVFWQYGLQLARYVFPFLSIPYLTRVLGPDHYAVYAYVLSCMVFFEVIAEFGFNLYGTKKISECLDEREMGVVLVSITRARIMLMFALAGILFVVSRFIPLLSNNMLYVYFVFFAVSLRACMPDFVFQGKEDMKPITVRFTIAKAISTFSIFVFVHSPDDMLWIPTLDIVGCGVAMVWAFWVVWSKYGIRPRWSKWKNSFTDLANSFQYCLSNITAQILSGFATVVIGIVVIDQKEIAFWSLSMTVLSAISSLYSPIVNSLYSHMVIHQDRKLAKKLAIGGVPVVLCVSVGLFVCADWIMLILGGSEYLDGSRLLRFLSPVSFFCYFSMLFGWPMLGALGRVEQLTKTTVGTSCVYVIALTIWAIMGLQSLVLVAIARAGAEFLLFISRFCMCRRYLASEDRDG